MPRGSTTSRMVAALTGLALVAGPASPPAAAAPSDRAAAGASVIAEETIGPRLVDLTIQSPALGGTATVRLLTPDGWAERDRRDRWPVLYLLHGCCDSYLSWTRSTDVASIPELRDVLVVMPEAGAAGWYSDWWNFGAGGTPGWETFHLRELRKILEHGYGAGPKRAIAGLSMGGFGAMSYAARNPGMFRAAASFSGVVHPSADAQFWLPFFGRTGQDPYALWGDPVAQRAIWAAHDPYDLAKRLRHTKLFLATGDGTAGGPFDPPGRTDGLEALIHRENVAFADRLEQLGVDVTTNFYGPGTHSWPYWQRELHRALPMLLDALHVRAGVGRG
ncbi:S-formylglutathione hydrolase FrmB [Micromonospora pattaloongensis]|uniref:S-formylglutathione hydrolase FrmB n=1 Tax=Micromonospora pattaloongensis TaxID=405436 RepID=A0A1H3LY17_9ACTN|nr:alpha/beta hydrolase family protein [Micromonospora pattaloongensis]SDY68929.1 S-formylglutathione hydrolase FrmB [Micromonospora pattaloongensis]